MTISIPWIPPTLNRLVRGHWTVRYKATETCATWIAALEGKRKHETHRVRVTVQMYRSRVMDRDGAWGAAKPVFDAVVRCGYAVDDSEKWMEMNVLPVKVDRNHRTEISIERSK